MLLYIRDLEVETFNLENQFPHGHQETNTEIQR